MAASKSKSPKSSTEGMQGEDFAYGGAGSKSDAKKRAVVSGEVKEANRAPTDQKAVKGSTNDPDWGSRKEGQQMPGGMPEAERAGKKSSGSK